MFLFVTEALRLFTIVFSFLFHFCCFHIFIKVGSSISLTITTMMASMSTIYHGVVDHLIQYIINPIVRSVWMYGIHM